MNKKLISIVLVVVFLHLGIAVAENGYPPYDYLINEGFDIEWLIESPGWRTCNIMGGYNWYSLSFSDLKDDWTIQKDFATQSEKKELEKYLVYLVENFDWDVSFYWPGYGAGDKMEISYNIVNDIDNTKENYYDKDEYVAALKARFGLGDTPEGPTMSPEEYQDLYKSQCKEYTYKAIARNPEKVKGEYAVVSGEVIQVLEYGNNVNLRVNITEEAWGYTDTIYVIYTRKSSDEDRILEDDIITIWGKLSGLETYESTLGKQVVLPKLDAEYIRIDSLI